MKLIIGGAFQGKTKAAQERYGFGLEEITDVKNCDFGDLYSCKVMIHFHEYIKRVLEQKADLSTIIKRMFEENPGVILICNEMGYGVVPMEPFDREYRETVGRTCCMVAKEAEEVIRVICGIGTVIKGA